MAHHAYLYAGERDEGLLAARRFAEAVLGLSGTDNPDLVVFEYGLFSVDDARRVGAFAGQAPLQGNNKLIVLAVGRLFHEAQNALLKLFEEPSEGTTLILIVPAEGILLPTLRSRLIQLPYDAEDGPGFGAVADAFLAASKAEREKLVTKLLARTKADKDDEKQQARLEAVALVSGLTRAVYEAKRKTPDAPELTLLLRDLDRFLPILHERSAPLKMIFEHLLLVMPQKLQK